MQSDASTIDVSPQTARPQTSSPRTVPGPPVNVLSLLSFLLFGSPQDLLGFYMNATQEYGDIVSFGGTSAWATYFVSHPDYVKHILQDNNHNYGKKNWLNDMIKPLAGEGLLTSEGDGWRRRRKLAQPAFHRERIAAFATGMTNTTTTMLERWEPVVGQQQPQQSQRQQQSIDIVHEMQRLTLGIVSTALFSIDISGDSDEMGSALNDIFAYFNHRSRTPLSLPASIPTRRNRRFKHAVQRLDAITYQVIEEHRQSETKSDDLLSMLLEARDEETGEGLSNIQLRDEVGTFLAAGHETTAMTLSWTWYMLSKHPAVEHKLHAELTEVLSGRLPTAADIPQLRYTRMVIQEVMRLYPAAWAMTRGIVEDDEIGGYPIKAGAIMILSPYVTHRHPDFWDNPEGFDPERFTPERIAERPRYAYFPFGGGPRQCIGNEFALMEAQLIVAMVAQRYRLDLIPGQKIEPDPIFTLRPKTAVRFALHAR